MKFKNTKIAFAMGVLLASASTLSWADTVVSDIANYVIVGNSDGFTNGEGVKIYSTNVGGSVPGGASMTLTANGNGTSPLVNITGATTVTGNTSVVGTLGVSSNATVGGTLGVTGNTALNGTLSVAGATSLSSTLNVSGLSTTAGITNTGAFNQTGASVLTGSLTQSGGNVSLNATGTGNVTIGNALNTTNINSNVNNIGAGYASTNNIGTGGTATVTNIGNAQTATQVTATAGNAVMSLSNNNAALTVPSGVAGINNGVSVSNTQSSLTGGSSNPTSLTMNDNAATFGRASNGAPITVTGVADGRNPFDAVNVRQFSSAIASVTAQANVPTLAAGQDRSIGLGLGNYMGRAGMAVGMNVRGDADTVFKLTASTGLNGGGKAAVGMGAAWAF